MEMSYSAINIPQQLRNVAHDNESTFTQPNMVQRLQKDLHEIFKIKEVSYLIYTEKFIPILSLRWLV